MNRNQKIEARRAKAKALQASIAEQVEALRDSDAWLTMLAFMGKFHNYSLNNVLLILGQNPDASAVAGFRKWQELGRQVRKGEKSLKIFGFREITTEQDDPDTGEKDETKHAIFPMLSVFDISQTDLIDQDGYDPGAIAPHLTGDLNGHADRVTKVVTDFLTGKGWTVTREEIPGETNGFTRTDGSKIVTIDAALSPAQEAKTLLHEAGHVLLHAEQPHAQYIAHRGQWETEAESVAYVTAGLLNLDTATYSIGYVAGWSQGDSEMIHDTAVNVLKAVHILADALGV